MSHEMYNIDKDYGDKVQAAQTAAAEMAAAGYACGTVAPRDDNYIIEQLFTYHSPTLSQLATYETIREAAKYFAKVLLNNVPQGADRTAAIRKLREAVFTANAGIALGGLSL